MRFFLLFVAFLLIPAETLGAKELPEPKINLSAIEEYNLRNPRPAIYRRPSRTRTVYRREQDRHSFKAWKARINAQRKRRLGLSIRKNSRLSAQDISVIAARNKRNREFVPKYPCTNNELYNEKYLPNCYKSSRK